MCDSYAEQTATPAARTLTVAGRTGSRRIRSFDISPLTDAARRLVTEGELRRSAVGFIGYAATRPGDRVLLAVDTEYEPVVVEAVAEALRERGAIVDQLIFDAGPDREFTETDEIDAIMRRVPLRQDPRRWDNEHPVIIAIQQGTGAYDLVVHGKGGPIPDTVYRFEALPWLDADSFLQTASSFPRAVHELVNRKIWRLIWERGRGARVNLCDPEGTELTWTLHRGYFDGTRVGFRATPYYGHLMAHPAEPLLPEEDATGVVAGTTNHFSKPFPRIELTLDKGRLEQVAGGGDFGEAWRRMHAETESIKYPGFPREGLFWLCEAAFGTHPKVVRPRNLRMLSSGGFEVERRKSGYMHVGIGTFWRSPTEHWAGDTGNLYGHLHVHQMRPNLVLAPTSGPSVNIIDDGRLTMLDDPEVRDLAAEYGDPDELLSETWKPTVPGLSAAGDYDTYSRNPAPFYYEEGP